MFSYFIKYGIILLVRDLFKLIIVGIVLTLSPLAFAEDYKVLVLPDNIVTEAAAIDSYIYNATAEFFADEIASTLDATDYISAPSVSEIRKNLKSNPSDMLATKALTQRFRTTYNIDYLELKKIAQKSDARYALLVTSAVDAENYVLRRTVWDFLNIPGASVVDPAYKISTYAVLVDTEKNSKIWSDTFYKTISVCENRIITRGPSPQTEQLQKIKDYSRYVCPQIARNVQRNILPADIYEQESTQIDYDMGNIDNVFTKKYRHLRKESDKIYQQNKQGCSLFIDDTKQKFNETKQRILENNAIKKEAQSEELKKRLEVEAKPVDENNIENGIQEISNKNREDAALKNAVYTKKQGDMLEYSELINIEINKKKKHNLFGDYDIYRPELRNYSK